MSVNCVIGCERQIAMPTEWTSASMRSKTLKGSAINGDLRRAHRVARLTDGGVLMALLAHGLGPAFGHAQEASAPIPTDRELQVACIGDTGNGAGFMRVFQLNMSEGAHLV